jgi:hypothetical protein
VINTLDLSYYPSERGPYNNNNFAANPSENYGGIMRSLNSTNFEQGMGIHSILGYGSLCGTRRFLKIIQENIFQFREISEMF